MNPWATTPRIAAAIAARADTPFEEIAVAEGRRSGEDHLGDGQHGAGIDGLSVDETSLGGKDVVVEPGHQGKVIGKTPEENHRKMGVGVDQSRHNDAARGIDDLARLRGITGGRFPFSTKMILPSRMPITGVLDNLLRRRHGKERSAGNQDVEFLF